MIWNTSYPKNLQVNKIWGGGGIPQLLPPNTLLYILYILCHFGFSYSQDTTC